GEQQRARGGRRHRGVDPAAEPGGEVAVVPAEGGDGDQPGGGGPAGAGEHRGALLLVGGPDGGAAVQGEVVGLGQQLQPHQVGGLPVPGDRLIGGFAVAGAGGPGLGDQPLVGAEPVDDLADVALLGAAARGELGGLHQGGAGLAAPAVVDPLGLLGLVGVADQQDVGGLGVHVAERQVQVAGGGDLGARAVPDDLEALPDLGHRGGGRGEQQAGGDHRGQRGQPDPAG